LGFLSFFRRRTGFRGRGPYPTIRGELLKRCHNPDTASKAMEGKTVHPIERALIEWGHRNLRELVSRSGDVAGDPKLDVPSEIEDSVRSYFTLFAQLVDWRYDENDRTVHIRYDDPDDEAEGFKSVRLRPH